MCGILGYVGLNAGRENSKKIVPLLLDGLRKLEYRGYDSAGICIVTGNGLSVTKRKGSISELENAVDQNIDSDVGIAHTRWATHGEPNEKNAHPHTDCTQSVAVAHNGIIENYHALKELLQKEGHSFRSDTDTEIVAHLIEKFYDDDLETAVVKALECVEGAFGLVVIHKDEKKIVAARRSSPLVIGIGDGEMFIASDVTAILGHTKNVVYLKENEIAVISADDYSIKTLDGNHVEADVQEIKWSSEQIEKGGFPHFMLKEIYEQAQAIKNTMRGRVKDGTIKLSVNFDLQKVKKIVITACGTSWHAALIGKYLIEHLTRIPVEVDYASEFRYRDPLIGENDLFIAISQSGETADTLAALRKAKESGAQTLGIVNVVGSSISREVDSGMYLHAGPEIGVASTKAFTSHLTAIVLLTLFLQKQKGINVKKEILHELGSVPEKIQSILDNADDIKKIAEQFKDATNFLYLGRGVNFPVALEGALKLKEISYIHAEGYPAAEMKHGPIALIDQNMPVVFIATKNSLSEKIMSNMEEVKARNGRIIAIVSEQDDSIEKLADYTIQVPQTLDEVSPIINAIPLQLLAYYIAALKGKNVDKPRNLAKSVTVE